MADDLKERLDAAIADVSGKLDESAGRLDANLREGQHLIALDRAARRIAALEEQIKDLEQQVRQLRDEAFIAWSRVADVELALDVATRASPGPMPTRETQGIAQKDLRNSATLPPGTVLA